MLGGQRRPGGRMSLPKLTLGLEEEYQIVHPETRALTSYIQQFLERGRVVLKDQIQPEFLQSQVEVGSHVCHSIGEAKQELCRLRGAVKELADGEGLCVVAAGTHPFSTWMEQQVTAGERYAKHEINMASVARQMLCFGMHVHVGIPDPEMLIDVMTQSRYFMPHILALSTSSPFWEGRDSGLKSYRSIVIGNLPRSGLPPRFSARSEYDRFLDTLIGTNCIDEPTKIWWDIRPSPKFPTVEFRIMDICTRVDEAICITALLMGIVGKLIKLRQANMTWRDYRLHLITENKWRAVRYGIEAKLIDFGKQTEVPVAELVQEMLGFIEDVVDELGIRQETQYVHKILRDGTSADRQLRVYKETQSLEAVVDHLIRETAEGT
jgi:carboxylate-amine ligase